MVKSDSELFNPFEMKDIYNDYVSFYNDSEKAKTDLIKAMSELSIILSTVEKHEDEFIADCQGVINKLFELFNDTPQEDSNGRGDKNKVINALLSYFESNDINSKIIPENLHDIDYLINVTDTLSHTLDSKKKQLLIQLSLINLRIIQSSFVENHKHKVSLKKVTRKIISGLYPEQLPYFNELSEDEKTELRSNDSRVGAPPSKDVPQDKVEQIVKDLLKKSERGVRVETSRDGKKMMFQVVHDKGKRRGRANFNQILKYFEFAYPNLLAISDRQFVKRIKKAVPEGMK